MLRARAFHLIAAILLLPALIAVIDGCGGATAIDVVAPPPDPLAGMPAPASPSGVVRAFEWGWEQRSPAGYRRLFTADYVFTFSTRDSAGSAWPPPTWGRDPEEGSFATIVSGGNADQPAATQIALTLDKNFTVLNDPRPGMNDAIHRKSITTQVNLTVTTADGASTNIFGSATFYLVRGDSAAIPSGLGLAPDSTRWYVDGWLDNTNGTGATPATTADPTPTKGATWGALKARYLPVSMNR